VSPVKKHEFLAGWQAVEKGRLAVYLAWQASRLHNRAGQQVP